MSESLVEILKRMQKEIDLLKSSPIPKPIKNDRSIEEEIKKIVDIKYVNELYRK